MLWLSVIAKMQNINYAFLLSRPIWGAWIEIIIDAINNRERLRKIAFPNVSDQFIFCKNTDGGRAFVFAFFQRSVNAYAFAIPVKRREKALVVVKCNARNGAS